MIETPVVVQVPAFQVAAVPVTVPRERIREVMGPAIREVYEALQAQGIPPAGPWLTYHLRRPSETFEFRACVPVGTPVTPVGRVVPWTVPAARVAKSALHGPYEGLFQAWPELETWVEAQGLKPLGPLWEVYRVGPESTPDPAAWRTELYRPLVG